MVIAGEERLKIKIVSKVHGSHAIPSNDSIDMQISAFQCVIFHIVIIIQSIRNIKSTETHTHTHSIVRIFGRKKSKGGLSMNIAKTKVKQKQTNEHIQNSAHNTIESENQN